MLCPYVLWQDRSCIMVMVICVKSVARGKIRALKFHLKAAPLCENERIADNSRFDYEAVSKLKKAASGGNNDQDPLTDFKTSLIDANFRTTA